jgi:murein DD-endopeptidase MepM/ murein hydrolase activator NlpD
MKLPLVCGIFASLLVVATEASARPKPQAPANTAEPQLQVSTRTPKPGDPVLVTVTDLARKPSGTGGRVPLVFFPVARGWQAVFAVPLANAPAEIKVKVGRLSETLTVRAHTFDEEAVKIAPEFAAPPADKRQQLAADNAAVINAVKHTSPPLFRGAFQMPGKGRRTSTFGSWRTFNGEHRSRHLGLDIGARKRTPVRAVQHGKVALVRDGFLMGGAVVLTHGAGIASAYFHLTDIAVAVGDVVKPGQALGKVGLTGRTTGPHIHLGIWVPGGFVDPATFLRLEIATPTLPADPAPNAKVSQPAPAADRPPAKRR